MERKFFLNVCLLLSVTCLSLGQQIARKDLDPTPTKLWDGEPRIVTPGKDWYAPPSDATVLFNGKDLSQWTRVSGGEPQWVLKDGVATVVKGSGDIKSKQTFGDVQLHVEWWCPSPPTGNGQGRCNSGVFLQERYEVQVLDSYENRTYSNGQAGSIYKQSIPMVNAMRKPGEWQSYDIVFVAPRFSERGTVVQAGYMTIFQNGVLIQNHFPLQGPTVDLGLPFYEPHGKASILLQEHGDAVSYRNIWVREL